MADHYFGVDMGGGADPSIVAEGTASTTKNEELRVHDGVTGNNKVEVLKASETIKNRIIKDNAPS